MHPWATNRAPASRATATVSAAMSGRASAETKGYFPSYSAFACSAGRQNDSAKRSRASMTRSVAPAASARAVTSSMSNSWPTSTSAATTSRPRSSRRVRAETDVSSPPE